MTPDAPNPAQGDAPDDRPEGAPTLTLAAALKLAGFAGTGGQAKRMIQAGEVQVNGSVETRRKHKLRPDDEITVGDETFVVELADDGSEADGSEADADDASRA
ncbi:MAG: RNA-binding S4 domain-containing protein [Trueperaceae bacterium]|nr:RNA-binding S4 domain-containing protein [Trueperaceae bacterium]